MATRPVPTFDPRTVYKCADYFGRCCPICHYWEKKHNTTEGLLAEAQGDVVIHACCAKIHKMCWRLFKKTQRIRVYARQSHPKYDRDQKAEMVAYVKKHPELSYSRIANEFDISEENLGMLARKAKLFRRKK
jgi:hypothetical protein